MKTSWKSELRNDTVRPITLVRGSHIMGTIKISIDHLLLDLENPRIDGAKNQQDALQKILDDQGEKLHALAEHIVNEGLNPTDRLLVLHENKSSKKYIALEGNRRVAALKLLINPHVLTNLDINASLQKKFEKIAKSFDRGKVEPLDCSTVSSREEGNQWIYLRHIGEDEGRGVVRWGGLATSRFRGKDPALQALEFVMKYGNLREDQKNLIGRTFPITTLDRLLSSPDVRGMIGVDVVKQKLVSGLPADEVMKPLRRIVLDLANKMVNVSQLKNKTDQANYVKSFNDVDKPNLSKNGAPRTIESIHDSDFTTKPSTKTLTKPRKPDPSERKTIAPTKAKLNIQDNRVASIYGELRKIKVDDFPNAGAVLLRVFLELSVDSYMDTHNIPRKFQGKNNRPQDKTLKVKVQEVVGHLVQNGCNKKDFNGVVRGLSMPASPFSVELLHDYVHNRFTSPNSRDLKSAWDNAQRFFEKIWA